MHYTLKQKVIDKVPDVVETILKNSDDIDVPNIRQTVCLYTKAGSLFHKDVFFIFDTEMLRHVEQAVRKHCDVTASDTGVTVRRNLSNGDYYIVDYVPIS